jgi:hypothetical protein
MTKEQIEQKFNTLKAEISQRLARMQEDSKMVSQIEGKLQLLQELYREADKTNASTAPEAPPARPEDQDGSTQRPASQNDSTAL